jgi:hypothetical protein
MKGKWVFVSLFLGLGLTLALLGFFTLTGRAAPGNPVLDPASNTHTAPSTTTVSITYDEDIDAATVTSRTFAVHGMQSGLVRATHGVSGSAITVDPVRPFHPGELVQASATTGTLNLSGEGPISPTVWQFRTAVQGGTGRFGPAARDAFGAGDSRAVALGDLDGDGDLDAVVANYSGQAQEAWFNAGDGTYPISIAFGSGDSWAVALGDVDGDGDLDAVVANRNDQAQEAWLNDGSGTFPISRTFGSGYDSRGVALGDLDGDGDLDAVMANNDQAQVAFLNGGLGTFSTSTTFGGGDSHDVALGDLDGDGDLDAVVANGGGQAQDVCFNDGSGAFTCTDFGAGRMQAVALGDVEGDGDLDAVLAGNNGDPQEVWFNDGSGAFLVSDTFGAGTSHGLALGDLDGDGDLDAVVANYSGEAQEAWFNAGDGTYPISRTFGAGDSWDVALGDADGDGDLDAVVANDNGQAQEVWLNGDAIYVDADAAGADDGSSWADAYVHLQDALDEANGYSGTAACEIWVAEGVYYPDEDGDGDHVDDVVSETFRLSYDGIQLYGGFDGTEGARDARDPEVHVTVLSGDIDGNDTTDARGVVTDTDHLSGTNATHVLRLDGVTNEPITGDTVIDGFVVTAGYADGSGDHIFGGGLYCDGSDGGECSPRLARIIFSGNQAIVGGGIYNDGSDGGEGSPELVGVTFSGNQASYGGGGMYSGGYGGTSSPLLTDVIFSGNQAGNLGGGMWNDGSNYITSTSSPVLVNVIFSGNRADWGGGMVNDGEWGTSSPKLTNVTFSGNQATYGGGMLNGGGNGGTSSPVLTNVILWGNTAPTGTVMYNYAATPTIAYSLVQGGWDGSGIYNENGGSVTDGGGNIDADPLFVRDPDPGDGDWTTPDDNDYGDLRLQHTSPAIDAGDNAAVPAGITTDLAGLPRFVDIPTVPDTGSGTPPIVDMGAYEAQYMLYLPLVLRGD